MFEYSKRTRLRLKRVIVNRYGEFKRGFKPTRARHEFLNQLNIQCFQMFSISIVLSRITHAGIFKKAVAHSIF